MIITTTNSIEGAPIQKYLGLVTSNLVIGTNVISDFVASFSDFFGGMSGQYRDQLNLLYERAIKDLTRKALTKGANAILGTRLDFDEISGKGKSMFMVSISGTAVRCQLESDPTSNEAIDPKNSISDRALCIAQFLNKWNDVEKSNISDKKWEFIANHELPEIAEDLLVHRMRKLSDPTFSHKDFDSKLWDYLNKIDTDTKLKSVYDAYNKLAKFPDVDENEQDYFFQRIIDQFCLFSPAHILRLINDGKIKFAISLLSASKPSYSREDLTEMEKIVDCFDNLPDTGYIKEEKVSLFSSNMKKVFVCEHDHSNDIENEYCTTFGCGCNIKGLTETQVNAIETFRTKVALLRGLLEASEN